MKKTAFFIIPLFLIGLAAYLFVRLSKKRNDNSSTTKTQPKPDDLLNDASGEFYEEIYDYDEDGNPLFNTYYA